MRPNARFIVKFVIVQFVTYVITGIIAFNTFMVEAYTGPDALFSAFLITTDDPEWSNLIMKIIPIQIIRGLLLGMIFYSLSKSLRNMSYRRRFIMFLGFYFVLGFLAGPSIGPGTLEGMIYMLPEYSPKGHFLVLCEIALQSIMLSAWMAFWMRTDKKNTKNQEANAN